jgi:hypothetical protein
MLRPLSERVPAGPRGRAGTARLRRYAISMLDINAFQFASETRSW